MRQVVDCVLEDNDLGAFMAGAMSANASMILLNNSVFGTPASVSLPGRV